jgi:hypothetical protein
LSAERAEQVKEQNRRSSQKERAKWKSENASSYHKRFYKPWSTLPPERLEKVRQMSRESKKRFKEKKELEQPRQKKKRRSRKGKEKMAQE